MNRPPRLRDVTIGALATDPAIPCTRWVIPSPAGFPCPWSAIPCTRWVLWPLIHPLGAHGRIDSPAAACALASRRPAMQWPAMAIACDPAAAQSKIRASCAMGPGRADGRRGQDWEVSRTIFYFFKLTRYPLGSSPTSCTHPNIPLESVTLWNH